MAELGGRESTVNSSRALTRAVAVMAAVTATVLGLVAGPTAPASADVTPTGTVGTTPASYTPWLRSTTPGQNVRRLVPCGSQMFAVGAISDIQQGSTVYTRYNAFSFSQDTGAVSDWAPQVNGRVNDIALSPDCSVAYLGGNFSVVDGVGVSNLVAVDTTTGAVLTRFKHNANAPVSTVDYAHGFVLVGGAFTRINAAPRTEFASLNPTTGRTNRYAVVSFAGQYPNTTKHVDNSQLSHAGDKLLIEGVFTSINGQKRHQVAILDLGATVTLDSWNSPDAVHPCMKDESYYIRAGAWSPDDSTVYFASTGYKPRYGPGSRTSQPRAGLCDAAFALSATGGAQPLQWINYTGCDSYYGVVADDTHVYVTGHERWADNPDGCDTAGPGAVSRPGLADLDPTAGGAVDPSWNPTRSLGHGGDDLVLTAAGLWVASDNGTQGTSQMCGRVFKNKGGICFLPYPPAP